MPTYINKRYIFLNELTNKETILELDLEVQKLSIIQYEGNKIEEDFQIAATLNAGNNPMLLLSVLDLFTQECGLTHIEYISIGDN
jgi:hypothetical protein